MVRNPSTSLGYRFGMLSRLNMHFLNQALRPLGNRVGQVACLADLFVQDAPMTQEEISQAQAIDPAATASKAN